MAEAIIFRAAEKSVQGAPWYAQGYRANTVAYSLALPMNRINQRSLTLDIPRLWREQSVGDVFLSELL